jgi:hypothetical protein
MFFGALSLICRLYLYLILHACNEIKQSLKNINANCPEEEELFVEFLEPCLTSIYYHPDVVVIGTMKNQRGISKPYFQAFL